MMIDVKEENLDVWMFWNQRRGLRRKDWELYEHRNSTNKFRCRQKL